MRAFHHRGSGALKRMQLIMGSNWIGLEIATNHSIANWTSETKFFQKDCLFILRPWQNITQACSHAQCDARISDLKFCNVQRRIDAYLAAYLDTVHGVEQM